MAKFEMIADLIKQRIDDGTYSSAQKLPSEYQLSVEFDVSRLTVRKAIDALIQAQILIKDPGKGTYIMSPPTQDKVESGRMGLQGFTEAAKMYGKNTRTEVLSFEPLVNPDPTVQQQLDLAHRLHPAVSKLVRRRFWDDEPMTVESIVILDEYIPEMTAQDFTGSLFDLLSQRVEIAYSHQEIEAILVDATMAGLLAVKVGDPLLRVQSVTYTADARPIFFDTSYYRADKYAFKSTLTRFR